MLIEVWTYGIPLGSHTIPQRLGPFSAQDAEDHHERMEEILKVPARNGIWMKVLGRVIATKELHTDDGEDVNDDGQNECQIGQSSQRRQDDTQQDSHRRP